MTACLRDRADGIRALLSGAFGGDSALFWSLYSSIWPKLSRPMEESVEDLLGLRTVDMGDIDRPWRFVTEGWIEFEEE